MYVVFDLQEDERPCKLFISIIDEHPMDVIAGKLKSSFGSTDNSRRLQNSAQMGDPLKNCKELKKLSD
jgi:hypothetical protein